MQEEVKRFYPLRNNLGFFLVPVLMTVIIVGIGLAGYFNIKKNEYQGIIKTEVHIATQFAAEDMLRRYGYIVRSADSTNWRIKSILDGYNHIDSMDEIVDESGSGQIEVWQRKSLINPGSDHHLGVYTTSYFYGDPPIYVRIPEVLVVDFDKDEIIPKQIKSSGEIIDYSGSYSNLNTCEGIRVENIPLENYYGEAVADHPQKMLFTHVIIKKSPVEEDKMVVKTYCSPKALIFKTKVDENDPAGI